MSVGEIIKKIRLEKGWTQKQLAEKSNLVETTIRKYELGKQKPKNENLQKIARAFNVPMYLLAEEFLDQKTMDLLNKDVGLYIKIFPMAMRKVRMEQIYSCFDILNEEGQDEAVKYIQLLTEVPKYKKNDEETETALQNNE